MALFVKKKTFKGMPYFYPVGEGQRDKLGKVKDDDTFEVTMKRHRSAKENATYWAFVGFLYKDTECGNGFNSIESFQQWVQLSIGACDIVEVKGQTHYILWSKKFSEMKQNEFHEKIMNPTIEFVLKEFGIDFLDWKENKDFIA